jgi:hypothetical protein
VFLGAGASIAAGLPSWQDLVSILASELGIAADFADGSFSSMNLLNIPQYYQNDRGRRSLITQLDAALASHGPSPIHDLIAALPTDLFYTTNFDHLLENALAAAERDRYALIVDENDARAYADHDGVEIRKLHGTLGRHESIVLTRRDFAEFRHRSPLLLGGLSTHLASHTFLFVGYSLSDPDFGLIFDDVLRNMDDMKQFHYFCAPAITDHEREDLNQRGVKAIALAEWSDGDASAGLAAFLTSLTTATSDLTHVKRFFSGLRRGATVPIIVSSRTHEHEQYVFIPECDLHVANEVERALQLLGCTARRMADRRAIGDSDMLAGHDLVLVCSPFANQVTHAVFADPALTEHGPRVSFREDGGSRLLLIDATRDEFRGDNPVRADASRHYQERALVARYRNPWNPERHVFVFAGLHALGTHAVGHFLSDTSNFAKLPDMDTPLEAILTVGYSDHDPYDYRYEIEAVWVREHGAVG